MNRPPATTADRAAENTVRVTVRQLGFSLIELVVVLVLMAIMASLATLSIRGVIARQRLSRAVEVVEQFDTALRRAALNRRRNVVGVINRRYGELVVDKSNDGSPMFKLPRQVSIDRLRLGPSRGANLDNQVVAAADGSTRTYAMRLSIGDSHRWILMAGGSGQIVHGLDNTSVNTLLGIR